MAYLEKLRERFQNVANFLIVYIKEAHPEDEWQMDSNREKGVVFNQPTSMDERMTLASAFVDQMEVNTPVLVDDIRNTANACYAAWPERLYVINTEGLIEYKGGMGPFGFKPEDVEELLEEKYPSAQGGR